MDELTPKQQKIWDIDLKFVRGDGKAIENITITIGALFDLYAEEFGYTRPKEEVGDVMKEFDKEFEFAYTTSRCTVFRKTKLYEYIKSFIRKHLSQPIRLPGKRKENIGIYYQDTLNYGYNQALSDIAGLNKKGEL